MISALLMMDGGSCHPTYHGLRLWEVFQLEVLVSNQVSSSFLNKTRKKPNKKLRKHLNAYHIYFKIWMFSRYFNISMLFKKNIAVSCLIYYENITILLCLQNFTRAVENIKNNVKFFWSPVLQMNCAKLRLVIRKLKNMIVKRVKWQVQNKLDTRF